jgi:uncharacterized membrane-anchored protein
MLRALIIFTLVALIAFAAVVLADLDGRVVVQVENQEYRLFLPVAAAIVIVLTILTNTAYRIITTFIDAPA